MVETVTPNIDITFKGNKGHPERVIQGLFRVGGPYLNLPSEIPFDAQRSARELIGLYKPHIAKHGENSVAQLCPSKHNFEALTKKGLDLVYQQQRTKVKATFLINTIDQLKGLFEVLDDNPAIRVFMHGESNCTRVRVNLNPLREKLNSWVNSFDGKHQQESQ
ncbi:hypothetical protein A3D07_02380 [Candidatus Curtissbacteria bacterium RIFCSPHIGHO2_02_FULL_42_15]|uniref:Uncharacterized protein n=1 Tax=Candidatus Curtissbacteria bacterium RIFCSPHIGHO2_02_FULL_42_15 TaxID=1797716 RepID=A0A1F5GIQ6_9BACT|nr:MAG: hypothetical protein A3D07_02380 [Candidatus Curtissbacteria bacterium RIFCSPHIGHO2_02_FULL_42_15]